MNSKISPTISKQQIFHNKIKALSTPLLEKLISIAKDSITEPAIFLLETCLDELKTRIPEKEFVTFCNNL